MTITYDPDSEFILDISEDTEIALQANHDAKVTYVPQQRFYVERCVTCNDKPLWGCSLWPCEESKSCFIICPTCGQRGFGAKPENWVPDHDLAALLLEKMGR